MVTPHASFLALRYRPHRAVRNLARLEALPGMYGRWGFRDSVNVTTGTVSDGYLSLDQGMVMAALGNALGDDVVRDAFVDARPASPGPAGAGRRGVRGLAPRLHRARDRRPRRPGRAPAGDDVICGFGGDDVVRAGGGDDVVYGDAGDDVVRGGRGDDTAVRRHR